jgi:hypothetical protein
MEPYSFLARLVQFAKKSITENFAFFFPGALAGFFSAKSLLFAGLPSEFVTFWAYMVKFVASVVMAVGSGFGTAYGADKFKRWREKKSPDTTENTKRKRA